MHEFQLLRINANSETPLPLYSSTSAACHQDESACVACVALLLNLTMSLPLAQSSHCMNPMIANRRTSNRKPFRQSNSAAEMVLPCLLA